MMDTAVTIKIFGTPDHQSKWDQAMQAAAARMATIDSIADNYNHSSNITEINRLASHQPVPLTDDMRQMLQLSLKLYNVTEGAFNPAIGALTKLWGFGRRDEMRVPSADEIKFTLEHIDAGGIRLQNHTVSFDDSCLQLDLGGIAKGYAVDLAIQTLQQYGIGDAQVDAGGDLRAICTSLTKGRRHVYVRHPRQSEAFFGFFALDSGAVATSGDYERYFMKDGIRYHHIFDGKTGYPARECVSVTIVGQSAAEADALATAVFVLGPKAGIEMVENIPGIEGLIIYQQENKLRYLLSSGLSAKFHLLDTASEQEDTCPDH